MFYETQRRELIFRFSSAFRMERIVEDYKALEAKAKEEHEKAKTAEQNAGNANKLVEEKVKAIDKLEGEIRSLKGTVTMLETKVSTRDSEIAALNTDLKNFSALASQRLLETNLAKKELNEERSKYADEVCNIKNELNKRREEFKDGMKAK